MSIRKLVFDEHQKIPDKMIEAIMAASGSAR